MSVDVLAGTGGGVFIMSGGTPSNCELAWFLRGEGERFGLPTISPKPVWRPRPSDSLPAGFVRDLKPRAPFATISFFD